MPTLSAAKWVNDKAQDPTFFPEVIRPKALEVGPQIQQTFAKAYKAGVKIMFGTDTGVAAHGANAQEFALHGRGGHAAHAGDPRRHQRAGQVPRTSMTRPAASPWASSASWWACRAIRSEDISVMEHVVFVMKDNTVYKAP